jgi:hypothetical protein
MGMRTGHGRSQDPRSSRAQWRARLLIEAGFPAEESERLAREERVDLHALLELVDRGCPPHLAVRILAPLDQPLESA